MTISSRLAGAALGAVLAIGIGGAGIAFAQEATTPSTDSTTTTVAGDPSTTTEAPATTEAPQAPAAADGAPATPAPAPATPDGQPRTGCPNKGADGTDADFRGPGGHGPRGADADDDADDNATTPPAATDATPQV